MANPRILYENRLNDGTPVASSTASGNVLNLRDFRNYTWWAPASLPATVTVDCGSAKAADYVLVYGHTLGTNGNTFELHGSTDNFAASDVTVATKTPTDDNPFAVFFNSTSYRYWRYRISGGTAPQLAIASHGARLEFPFPPDDGFDPVARAVIGQTNRSEQGNPLGTVVYFEEWRQKLTFSNIGNSFVRNSWIPAWKAWLRSAPFVLAWDADNYPSDLQYAQASGAFDDPHHWGALSDLSFEIFGVIL